MSASQTNISQLLLDNAVDAVSMGIEDLGMAAYDMRRGVTAVRNVFAGLLLVYKSHLAKISSSVNSALIWKNVSLRNVDGRWQYVPDERRTVDVDDILRLFKENGIRIDKEKLKRIRRYRNATEHYYDINNVPHNTVVEYVVDSLILVRDFIVQYIGKKPEEVFGRDVWHSFLHNNAIVANKRVERAELINGLEWFAPEVKELFLRMGCPHCSSDLLVPQRIDSSKAVEHSFSCFGCGRVSGYDDVVLAFCDDVMFSTIELAENNGIAVMTGFGECPECAGISFSDELGLCIACGYRDEPVCARCNESIVADEMDVYNAHGTCRRCQNLYDRDD